MAMKLAEMYPIVTDTFAEAERTLQEELESRSENTSNETKWKQNNCCAPKHHFTTRHTDSDIAITAASILQDQADMVAGHLGRIRSAVA